MTQTEARDSRQQLVDRARQGWIRRLVDFSRRNNLLYFRDLRRGTFDLTAHDPREMESLMNAGGVLISRLVPLPPEAGPEGEADRADTLIAIRRRAQENLEERGLLTLFIAHGFATWTPRDEGRPPAAAILLFPAELEQRGRDGRQMTLRITGEAQVNLVLLQALQDLAGIVLDPETLLAPDEEGRINLAAVFERVRAAAAGELPGFDIAPRWALGNFAFQKMALVRDLQEHGEELFAHDLIAALAGDGGARASITSDRVPIDVGIIDQLSPDAEFLVMDADSSQQRVVLAVSGGQDGVIQGPPGTGKSQVIVNLIATLAAEGKRVLFVAEKRAALDVVLRRLENIGLGHLALDLHGAELSRKQIMARVADALVKVRESVPPADDAIHRPFVEQRKRLAAHVARMHEPHAPSGRSVYQIEGELLALRDLQTAIRWRGPELARIDAPAERRVLDLLVEAGGFEGLALRTDPGPWNGARIATGDDAQAALDHASALTAGEWQTYRSALDALVGSAGLPQPVTLEDAARVEDLSIRAADLGGNYESALFEQDLDALANDLAPVTLGWLPALFARGFNGRFRRALKTARRLRRTSAGGKAMHGEVLIAKELVAAWGKEAPGTRPVVADVASLVAARAGVAPRLEWLDTHLERDLRKAPLTDLDALFPALAADATTPYRLPRLAEIESEVEARGAGAILGELRRLQPSVRDWGRVFEHAYLSSCLEEVRRADASIAGFNGRVHTQSVEEFCRLDRERLKVAVARVRRAHAEGAVATMNAHPAQDALIRREAQKKARHLPLRRLLAEAPDVLTALAPCWMASPLSVSQLLDGNQRYFDVVVFDEASQVLPEDAVSSLLRAQRAVVAGDSRQLPPTTFFAAIQDGGDGTDDPGSTEGFESLLDLMGAFLEPWPLQWHYRSRDEKLIAFSNHHIYDNSLVTFPGPGGTAPVRHELVQQPPGAGQEQSVGEEVQRVVELVLAHAEQRPDETLGVIAMGIEHADRVQRAIDQALLERPDLDPFFDQSQFERFFVKNLERVQGDERDAIILTVGYGKDERGRLPYRFGPLLTQGGERRLNVAVTRARRRVTVVSSFSHHDMDPGRSDARGVQLLRAYLEYAAQGGASWAEDERGAATLDAFQRDVKTALEARGLVLTPQWGASRYRLDFAVQSPDDESRFLLALETDGPNYQMVPTVRERDRTREQVLEGLGWRFHRIWATDWFMRREEEVERCLREFQAAVTPVPPPDGPAPVATAAEAALGATAPSDPARNPRPRIGRRASIDDYAPRELLAMVEWVQSDGRLRTDEEIVDELVDELGFSRRGARIESALRGAVNTYRTRNRT